MSVFWFRSLVFFLGMASTAAAATVKPTGIEASTFLISDKGHVYAVKHLLDSKADSAWMEGAEGSGLGSWIKIDLGASTEVTGVKLWNGYWVSLDFWQRHSRAKEVEVQTSDGTVHKFTLKDEMKPEMLRFPSPVKTDSIRIKIKSIYRGNTFNDTSISEIQVLDTSPSSFIQPSAYRTSSTLGGEYDSSNLSDGIKDTMWCEGNEAGDGAGEWVEFDFGATRTVSKLRMINGVGSGVEAFFNANHALEITLQFSDGSSWTGKPRSSLITQILAFPVKRASTVRMTFDVVKKGKKYNDLCLSEAIFLP